MPVYSINLTNRRLNILGIHIPKTGGTALNHFFKLMGFAEHFGTENHSIRSTMRCPPQHYHYDILDQILNISSFDFCFAVVRNPIERCWSDYHWAKKNTALSETNLLFDDWVQLVLEKYKENPFYLANHIRPQSDFVGPYIKKIFKFEDGLESALEQIFKSLGYESNNKLEIPKINVSEYSSDLICSSKTISLVQEFYFNDYINFNYKLS